MNSNLANKSDAGVLRALQQSLPDNQTTYLNNNQYDAIMAALNSANRTEDKYPNLYAALKGKLYVGDAIDEATMVDAGKTAAGKATANIWSQSKVATTLMGGSTYVFDHVSGELLAQGHNTSVQSGFLGCSTQADLASAAGSLIDVLYVGFSTSPDGSSRFYAYSRPSIPTTSSLVTRDLAAEDTPPCYEGSGGITAVVTAPCTTSNTNVQIAVGRTTGVTPPSTTDYIYCEATNIPSPYLIVPFVGNVGLSGTIDFGALSINNFETKIFVDDTDQSLTSERATAYTTDAKVLAAMSQGAAPNVLNWSFPFDGKGAGDNGYQTTNSLVYNPSSLVNEIECFFYFAFNNIPFTDGSAAEPFYVCSKDTPDESSINCTKILNLYFWWHCVAEGTMVILEDGSELPVEKVNETHRVRSANGQSYAVAATVKGLHSSDADGDGTRQDKILRVVTKNGKQLVATAHHTVFTADNQVEKMKHLAVGSTILTTDGPSEIVSIEPVEMKANFVGLMLGSPEEQSNPNFPTNKVGYYSGGILSGDQNTFIHHHKTGRLNTSAALTQVDEKLHVDYSSAVKQNRY
ncbi:Hint domain-containing protein [Phaeocystidibacter marisrubri]|uniref:Hint domain-containing protein n=1 Tax=Phaeocystidibacter marisrubri TaxID=1577780 RepID=A0A6L3ZFF0_9FLAO|nr:Hint domain-containing protein [Phaeocystidibacter marisrubri]KAB2816595.1 hypothetical protein F8C82_13010 [Phaeocystidibacter marisrubri]GGH69842.1 hypothetical protein GCM10011318_11290 [Phaeocystidibacter marisrubri]